MAGRYLIVTVLAAAALVAPAYAGESVPAPSPHSFAQTFLNLSNAYAVSNGDPTRVVHPDCVRAAPRHYMCSYATRLAGRSDVCRLMQALWTTNPTNPIKVTLAGRVRACTSLRAALDSLSS